jgi:hypothetical protein
MNILQALVTAILSGAFSGALLFGLNESRDRAEIALQKLERIYLLINEWAELQKTFYGHCFDIASGAMTLEQANAENSNLRKLSDATWGEATMLIYIYHSELVELLPPVMSSTKPLIQIRHDVSQDRLAGRPADTEKLALISDHLGNLMTAQLPLMMAISQRGRNIAKRPHLFDRATVPFRLIGLGKKR